MRQDPKYLETKMNYEFKNKELLLNALKHRSYAEINNERYEFLGDALLGVIIANALFSKFPKASEGELTRLRASLVKKESLAKLAHRFDINKYIFLGEGELKSGGLQRASILADCVEAVIAAIYMDSDFINCQRIVEAWYQDSLNNIDTDSSEKDPKTNLQEWLQARKHDLPIYEIVTEEGTAHDKQFTVTCTISKLGIKTTGCDSSRRKAEQQAAKLAMNEIIGK